MIYLLYGYLMISLTQLCFYAVSKYKSMGLNYSILSMIYKFILSILFGPIFMIFIIVSMNITNYLSNKINIEKRFLNFHKDALELKAVVDKLDTHDEISDSDCEKYVEKYLDLKLRSISLYTLSILMYFTVLINRASAVYFRYCYI